LPRRFAPHNRLRAEAADTKCHPERSEGSQQRMGIASTAAQSRNDERRASDQQQPITAGSAPELLGARARRAGVDLSVNEDAESEEQQRRSGDQPAVLF